MAKNVVFDENSAARIADAVKWVEQYSLDESPDDPYPDDPSFSEQNVIRGQFYDEWAIGTVAAVSYQTDAGGYSSKQAHNYFATVGAAGETNNCCIILAGTEWILIAAQCEEIPPLENEVD